MRVLGPRRGEEILKDAVRGGQGDRAPYLELYVGDLAYINDPETSSRVETIEWGTGDGDSPTMLLDATLSGRIPHEYQGAPVTLYVDFAGFRILEFTSAFSRFEHDGWTTKLKADTAGTYLDKVPMGNYQEYPNWLPEDVIRNALYRAPYNRAHVRVERFGAPRLNYVAGAAQGGFERRDHPASVLSKAFADIGAVAADTAENGVKSRLRPLLGVGHQTAWEYDADDAVEWTAPTLGSPDTQYTRVVVGYNEQSPPQGAPSFISREQKVDWSGRKYPPRVDVPLYVDFTEVGPDADANAARLAYQNARQAGSGVWKGEMKVPYNPFLEKWDALLLHERDYRDDSGRMNREWLPVLDHGVKHRGELHKALLTVLPCTMTLTRATRLRDPITLPGVSAGGSSAGAVPASAYAKPGLRPRVGLKPHVGLKPRPTTYS